MYKKVSKNNATHYIWGDRCDSWVLVDKNTMSVKLESMPPNTRENAHYHEKASQFFYLLKGEALFHINDGELVTLLAQEGLLIPPYTIHFIENKSNEIIDFLVTSQPTTNDDRFLAD